MRETKNKSSKAKKQKLTNKKGKTSKESEIEDYEFIKNNPKLKAVFWVLFVLSILLLVYVFRFYLWPALMALLFFIVLNPLYLKLKSILKGRGSLSSFIIIIGSLVLFFLPSIYLLIAVSREAVKASAILKKSIKLEAVSKVFSSHTFILETLKDFGIQPSEVIAKAMVVAQEGVNFIVNNITSFITGSFGIAFDLIIMSIILFFLLKESPAISSIFYEHLPFPYAMEHRIVKRIERVIRDVFYGNLLIMTIQGFILFIILWSFNIPSATLWGVIGGVFSIIPIISTSVVWIPVSIYFFINGDVTSGVLLSVLALTSAQILENIVKPKVLDKKLNIHPLILFFSLLGGIKAFGIVGLILGPAVVTLFVSFLEAYRVIEEFTPDEVKGK